MESSPENLISERKNKSCFGCKVSGSVSFFLVAAYFYYSCKHVKSVYYVGTPIMVSLAISRALDLPPFNN